METSPVFTTTVIGSGSATLVKGRFPSAQLIRYNNSHFLIDCGDGIPLQMVNLGLKISKIDWIGITHMHSDHVNGLPALLTSFNLMGRIAPLNIYGPPNLESAILNFLKECGTHELRYSVKFYSTPQSEVALLFETPEYSVSSIPLFHRIHCTGFLIKEKKGLQRSFGYLSDTLALESELPILKNVNLLYHEATFLDELAEKATATGHSTAKQAAYFAKKIGAKHLLIGHYSARYPNSTVLLQEAKSIFDFTTHAEAGLCLDI